MENKNQRIKIDQPERYGVVEHFAAKVHNLPFSKKRHHRRPQHSPLHGKQMQPIMQLSSGPTRVSKIAMETIQIWLDSRGANPNPNPTHKNIHPCITYQKKRVANPHRLNPPTSSNIPTRHRTQTKSHHSTSCTGDHAGVITVRAGPTQKKRPHSLTSAID